MNNQNIIKKFAVALLTAITIAGNAQNNNLLLWYKQPAENWNEALPVGNGRMGAMVFGGHTSERIQLNDQSLWSGSNFDSNPNVDPKKLHQIQQLILNGKIDEAQQLANNTLIGKNNQLRSYQPLADFYIEYSINEWIPEKISNYRRELNLQTGIAKTIFKYNNQTITQEVFASAPDNVIVVKISSDKSSGLAIKAFLTRIKDAIIQPISDSKLKMSGNVIDAPSLQSGPGGIHTAFEAQVLAVTDGQIVCQSNVFLIENATSIVFYITSATDYNLQKLNFDRSINPNQICENIIKGVEQKKLRHHS